jgi:hypothetical protein
VAEPSNPLRWYQGRRWYEWAGIASLVLLEVLIVWRLVSG